MKEDVIKRLVADFPNLKDGIESSLNDFSKIYLHLIFGDIFNPYLLSLLDDPQRNSAQLTKAGELLEYMANSSDYTQEVVVATVSERLADDPEKFKAFAAFAGGATKDLMRSVL